MSELTRLIIVLILIIIMLIIVLILKKSNKLEEQNNNLNKEIAVLKELTNRNKNNEILLKINEEAAKLNANQDVLKNAANEILNLQKILGDKKVRGIFGETQLYSIYERVFGNNNNKLYQKQFSLSNGLIADSVIFGPESLGTICVDSKFPLENFNRLVELDVNSDDFLKVFKAFKQDVKGKIVDIANKYIITGETANFAFMFIPAESVYNYILANMQDIVDLSYDKHVYLVSPTNLMAYIDSIKSLYLEINRRDNMVEMQVGLKKLEEEFNRMETRRTSLYKDVEKVLNDLKQLDTTYDKINNNFSKILNNEKK